MTGPPAGDHADDLLSAHIDEELDGATDAWVVTHLRDCPQCRSAAEALREVRWAVRSLPEVDARPVVEGLLARHRRLIRTGVGFVGMAAVVLGALALTAAVDNPRIVPDVEAMARTHAESAHGDMAGMRAVDEPRHHYAAPSGLRGSDVELSRQAVYSGSDLTAVLYGDSGTAVSVFEQPGTLDWDGLPAGLRRSVGDRPVWVAEGVPTVMVTELGDLVVTVVSEHPAAAFTAVAGLPERHRGSRWDRLHDACQRFTRVFALDGS